MNKLKKKIIFFYKNMRIALFYLTRIRNKKPPLKPRIVICFDGLFSHGGLLDRIKGIVSFYEIAKILDYDFFINFSHPFKLNEFLKPNLIDWELDSKKNNCSFFDTKIMYLMNDFHCDPLEEIKKSKATNYLVYSNVDYLGTIYKTNSQQENESIWRTNFNELFRKSIILKNELLSLPVDTRLVVHARFTSLMGDFKDTTSLVLKPEEKQELIDKLIDTIYEIALLNSNYVIYVLSDSSFFLDYIKKHTKFRVLSGKPKHVDFANGSGTNLSHLKTFSDFYFMVESEKIVLLRLSAMYNSSFSKYAAILGNKQFTIIQ